MLSYTEFCDKFNIRLDEQQAQAVQSTDRAVLAARRSRPRCVR